MAKNVLESSKVSKPIGIMSQGVKATGGHLIFASGQVSRDVDGNTVGVGDIKAQTRQVLENLKAVLEEGGATLDDVVKVTVFVTNVAEQFAQVHEVRSEFWKDGYPASTLVEISALANPELLIEIEALAVIP